MLIGLTGGIGSGKSTVANALREKGYAVYDCDREAKRIIQSDSEVQQALTALFGEEIYADGVYQTQVVASRVFQSPALLQQLNRIVHPAVCRDVLRWYHHLPEDKDAFVESAILLESGLADLCDKIVLVTAPLDVRIQRTIARDHTTAEQVERRIKNQLNDDVVRMRAHAIINNDGGHSVADLVGNMLQNI